MDCNITFLLNDKWTTYTGNPSVRLLDALRYEYNATGVKCGCNKGQCGACSVIIDCKLRNSCLVPMGSLNGADILTIEGFRNTEHFTTISNAFISQSSVNCGYCTPGMILASECLLRKNPKPSDAEIRTGLSGNLCKCMGYNAIVRAVNAASDIYDTESAVLNSRPAATGIFAEYNIIADNVAAVKNTTIIAPTTLKEALQSRKDYDYIPCCGGTGTYINKDCESKDYLFICQIPELKHIIEDETYIRFGAACTFTEVIEHEFTPDILREMCMQIGAPAIRNAGTLGGNIARGSAKADAALIFMVTDSKLHLVSADGQRTIPIKDFYLGDGEIDIEPDELITEILMPRRRNIDYYIKKVSSRNSLVLPDITFAGIVDIRNNEICNIAVAFGAISDVIIRVHSIDKMLIGKPADSAKDLKPDYLTAYEKVISTHCKGIDGGYTKTVCMNLLEDFFDSKVIS